MDLTELNTGSVLRVGERADVPVKRTYTGYYKANIMNELLKGNFELLFEDGEL
jgi:hypothetical protein